jgi:hypothetical protein
MVTLFNSVEISMDASYIPAIIGNCSSYLVHQGTDRHVLILGKWTDFESTDLRKEGYKIFISKLCIARDTKVGQRIFICNEEASGNHVSYSRRP